MSKIILVIQVSLLLNSCGQRYYMANMESGSYVDVTYYVSKLNYDTVMCHDQLVKIIDQNPYNAVALDNAALKRCFYDWANEVSDSMVNLMIANDTLSVWKRTTYSYSYIIYEDPVPVYETVFTVGDTTFSLFIRRENNTFYGPFMRDGWVTCGEYRK